MRSEAIPVDLKPHCMVCPNELPFARALNYDIRTCSPECAAIFKKWRNHQKWRRHCPSCLHPSTPEQREEFRRWRTNRGDRQGDKAEGRPANKKAAALATVLGEAREWVQDIRDTEVNSENDGSGVIQDEEAAGRIRELDSLLAKIAKLLDAPAAP